MSTKPREFDKVDRVLELEVIDWLQWGDEWDENKAALALQLISKRKSAYQALEQKLAVATQALSEIAEDFGTDHADGNTMIAHEALALINADAQKSETT